MAGEFYLHVGELWLSSCCNFICYNLLTVHSTSVRGGSIIVSFKVYNSPLTLRVQFLHTFPVTGVEVSAGPGAS